MTDEPPSAESPTSSPPRSETEPDGAPVRLRPDPAAAFRAAETPTDRFDQLYTGHAAFLTRQAYLLCGHRRVAERAVFHAFHHAWEEWPATASDPDPAVVVRVHTYKYALSPWHRLLPGHRLPEAHPGPPADRDILEALLSLPGAYRAALLLHDGIGIGLRAAAQELEASTPATAGRIMHARQALAQHWPELRTASQNRRSTLIAARLAELAAAQPVHNPPPEAVRAGSERTTRGWTHAAYGLTAVVAVAIVLGLVTASDGETPQRSDEQVTASPKSPRTDRGPGDAEPGPDEVLPGPGDPDGALGGEPVPQPSPHDGVPRGPGDTLPEVGPTGEAYVPQLRSTNRRVRLGEFAPSEGPSSRAGGREASGAPRPDSVPRAHRSPGWTPAPVRD